MPAIPHVVNRRILYSSPRNLTDAWRLVDNVGSVLNNGVGRFVPQLKRLSLYFERDWENSAGVREFIKEDLVSFAEKNPGVALYVIPKRHTAPYMVGEYLNGREARLHLSHFNREQMQKWVDYFRTRSGRQIASFPLDWRTDSPSIQGTWTPFTNVPTGDNVADFPIERPFVPTDESATDLLWELKKKQERLK